MTSLLLQNYTGSFSLQLHTHSGLGLEGVHSGT